MLVGLEQTIHQYLELKRGGNFQKLQLDAVAYPWELCFDLVLANYENVSVIP